MVLIAQIFTRQHSRSPAIGFGFACDRIHTPSCSEVRHGATAAECCVGRRPADPLLLDDHALCNACAFDTRHQTLPEDL
jgi:hypothetical protein